mmetsp:Transcript_12451/g.28701  ORF Transcript_12451/g.28701 Transcript_12451/m.28701 type:complete len:281 (+) Transcript_12451:94-936(+)
MQKNFEHLAERLEKVESERDAFKARVTNIANLKEQLAQQEIKIEELQAAQEAAKERETKLREAARKGEREAAARASWARLADAAKEDARKAWEELQVSSKRIVELEARLQTNENGGEDIGIMGDVTAERLKNSELEAEVLLLRQKVLELEASVAELRGVSEQDELREKKEKELKNVIAKITDIDEAMEGTLTCMACMELLTEALILSPCGHCLCSKCFEETKTKEDTNLGRAGQSHCPECKDDGGVPVPVRAELVDQLCAKFVFKKQAWAQLLELGVHAS